MTTMQKIFVLENTEIRQTGDGNTYGVTHVLAKTTNYMKLH